MVDVARAGAGGVDFAAEERQSPFSPSGFLIMLLAMAVEAVVLFVLLKQSPIALVSEVTPGELGPTATDTELLAPTVEVPEVIVSVHVREGEMRTAVLSVAIKLGKAEGRADEELDLRYLQKVYVPRVEALIPEFRHNLIMAASSHQFNDLRRQETQNKILENLKKAMNASLKDHGIEPRIAKLYWNSFHFD